jgi:hypothetical protein
MLFSLDRAERLVREGSRLRVATREFAILAAEVALRQWRTRAAGHLLSRSPVGQLRACLNDLHVARAASLAVADAVGSSD